MVERDKARRLLEILLDGLSDLRRYRDTVPREKMLAERDVQHMVMHALYVTIQSAVDLALHVGSDAELPVAATYRDAFTRLGEAGILDQSDALALADWAAFRNVLAHFYPVVDYARAYDGLRELAPLERFADRVAELLA